LSAAESIHAVARLVNNSSAVSDLPATRNQELEPEVGFCPSGSNATGGRIHV